jgi:hypothetical protein
MLNNNDNANIGSINSVRTEVLNDNSKMMNSVDDWLSKYHDPYGYLGNFTTALD